MKGYLYFGKLAVRSVGVDPGPHSRRSNNLYVGLRTTLQCVFFSENIIKARVGINKCVNNSYAWKITPQQIRAGASSMPGSEECHLKKKKCEIKI